ncbi:MAG: hypothetical protein ABI641_04850 [Caldimonas sp.]
MKYVFGLLSLVVVLAIVSSLMKTQLHALNGSSVTRASAAAAAAAQDEPRAGGDRDGATYAIPGGVPGAVAGVSNALTVPQHSQNLQQLARDRTTQALQKGMARNAGADR